MTIKFNKQHDEYWARPPLVPVNYIRSMLSNLEKDILVYKKREEISASKENVERMKLEEVYKRIETNSNLPIYRETLRDGKTIIYGPSGSAIVQKCKSPIVECKVENVPKKSQNEKSPNNSSKSPRKSQKTSKNNYIYSQYKKYKSMVMKANENRKVFSIYGEVYEPLRSSLKQRGWLEKLNSMQFKDLQAESLHNLLEKTKIGNQYEMVVISKLLAKYPPYFIWQFKNGREDFAYASPYRNRIKRLKEFDFTIKEGLLQCFESSHMHCIENVSMVKYPKFFKLINSEDIAEFTDDFRLTHCFSLLNYIFDSFDPKDQFSNSREGASVSCIEFAVDQIQKKIALRNHANVDKGFDFANFLASDLEWKEFMEKSREIVENRQKFNMAGNNEIFKYIEKCKQVFDEAKRYWNTISIDGCTNLWIMKPSRESCGRGIRLSRDLQTIINHAEKHKDQRYVVQKYLEKPLLIYKTKFDIRQYFLLTVTNTIKIWMYKDCYLKFSSQEYNLNNLGFAVHLTNNAIQRNFKNGPRSQQLPEHNMWSLQEFQNYLKSNGKENEWKNHIYPIMKQNIVAIVLSSLEGTELVANTFEFYGCDFILDENFEPYLLEVNSTPAMSASTCVTQKICPEVLQDIVKVVVDFPKKPNSSTGNFECIYEIPWTKVSNYSSGLVVRGKGIKLNKFNKCEQNFQYVKPITINFVEKSVVQNSKRNVKNRRKPASVRKQLDKKVASDNSKKAKMKVTSTASSILRKSIEIYKVNLKNEDDFRGNRIYDSSIVKSLRPPDFVDGVVLKKLTNKKTPREDTILNTFMDIVRQKSLL